MTKALLAALAALALNGCFFFYIPGSALDALTASEGNLCVAESTKTGDRIRMPGGQIGTVTKVSGASSRCQNAGTPIRAMVSAD